MHRRTAFRSYFLARLLLCVILLAQSSMASAASSNWPNRTGRATLATADGMRPGATGSRVSTNPSASAPAASCASNACAIYLPWLVAGVPPAITPTLPPTVTTLPTPTPTPPTPTPPTATPTLPPTPTPSILPTPTPPLPPASDTEPPSAPSNLRATGKTVTTISLAWDAAADNVAVTEYALYSSSTLVLTTTGLFATISELTASTIYAYTLIARDAAGNSSPASAQLSVYSAAQPGALDTHAPTTPAHLRAISKTHGTIALAWDSSSDDVAVAEYDLYDNSGWIGWTTATSFTITNLSAASGHIFTVKAYDTSGNVSDASAALPMTTDVPPDPAMSAPAVDQTVASDIAGDTAFIYSGVDPIQSGVALNTIQAQRVAILRGRVADRDGVPLAGAHISVHDHPEYGSTASRADGAFDLAVNGGGPLTVEYTKEGYLPAQRQVVAPWHDYVTLPDVSLIALDQAVTTISLSLDASSPLQAAAGSVVSDTDGVRQALLVFPADLTATLDLPDGAEQPLTTLHVRATEYTVGARGPQSMPGTLPPNSGFTYAVEYSVDEALAAGARQVRFSQPVIGYVENFLGFPVGTAVPAGYYDRARAAWIASDSGVIVKIIDIVDGRAALDFDGDGQADDPSALAISDAERGQLAGRYAVGQELWRVPVSHFTPWDFNWPFGPPADAIGPNGGSPSADKPIDNPCEREGSIIECQNQTLGEQLPVVGTPYHLRYTSGMATGYVANSTVRIPLSGSSVPASLARIDVQIEVAGRHFETSFTGGPNQTYDFIWDHKDAYGRSVQGWHAVSAQIGFVYAGSYQKTERFGYSGNGQAITGNRTRQELTFWTTWRDKIGAFELRGRGLGGWALDVHHGYDLGGAMLYRGDGGRQSIHAIEPIVTAVASNSIFEGITAAPDGTIYYTDRVQHTVWRLNQNDRELLAGGGGAGFSGDGGPATAAKFNRPMDVAIGPDGSLYIADSSNNRVRRIAKDGVVTTVAGNGIRDFSDVTNGALATAVSLCDPNGLAFGPDGSLYIASRLCNAIYRVGLDGRINTIVSSSAQGYGGDNGRATVAQLNHPTDIAVGTDGAIYIADTDNNRIRRIDTNGIITTIAGNGPIGWGNSQSTGDGGPATVARLDRPSSVAIGADGSLYIAEYYRVRWIRSDGVISSVVGDGIGGLPSYEAKPASQTRLVGTRGIALAPDGSLRIAVFYLGGNTTRILRLQPVMPSLTAHDLTIPSSDGAQLYLFDTAGRHLRTVDGLTGVPLYTFAYDPSGRLASVADRDGLVTRIERDAAGDPTAIVAPDGQRTTLALGADGYLAAIVNPAAEATAFDYHYGGLLAHLTDPRGGVHSFDYDALGRLTRDTNPIGGFTALSRAENAHGYTVTLTNALGDTSTATVENLPTGEQQRVNLASNGAVTISVARPGGVQESTDAQGNVTKIVEGPDPRWGWLAPFVTSISMRTANGQIYYTQTASRVTTLSNAGNALSVGLQTDTVTTNGHTTTTVYDGVAHTITTTDAAGKRTIMALDALGRLIGDQTTNLAPKQYVYDGYGRLASVSEGSGAATRTTTLAYNPTGAPASSTDPLGGTTTFVYDAAGRVTRQILPTGQALFFSYDAAGNRVSATNAQGIRTNFEYDLQNRLIAQTRDPEGRAVRLEFTYDSADNLLTQLDDAGAGRLNSATHYTYTSIGSRYAVSSVTDALGQRTELAYTPFGALQSATDPLGHTSVMTYTAHGWLAEVATPGGRTVRTTYDAQGRPASVTDPRGGRSVSSYDSLGRLQSVTAGAANVDGQPALNQTVAYIYDLNGRMVGMTNPAGQTSTRAYDIFGRPASVSDPLGNTTTFAYDALDRMVLKTFGANIPGEALRTAYSYDAAGRPLSERVDPDGLNLLTQYRYTRADSSDTWSLQEVVDPKDHATAFHFNSLGQRDQTIDSAGQIWRFTNDNLGRPVSQTDPLGHAVTYQVDPLGRTLALTEDGRTEHRSYRADGTLANTVDFAGRTTSLSYDADGRMLGVDYPAGTPDVAYTYDAAGNLTAMADGLGATSYAYDALNRLRERTRGGRTVGYSYDSNSQTAQIDYWGTGTVDYNYNSAGRLTSLTPWGASPTTYAYRGIGLLAEQTRGNGVTSAYGYDSASRLTSMLHAAGATNLDSIQYALDPNGNRTQVTDGDGTTSFGYDELNRLTSASYPAISGGPGASSVPYNLDALGNRLGDGATNFSYDASSRIANPGYSYDDNGNLLSDGTASYSYDAANRLIQSVKAGITTTYGYDGKGNLIRETVGGVTTDFVLDERGALPLILGEIRSDGAELRYAYGAEGVTAQQTISNSTQTISYPLLDALGSVRRLTDAAGAVTLARSYDAFGNIRHSAGLGWTPLGFTGERMGVADGTLYLRARHYSPALGRFLERDSYAGTLGRPQSLNRYAYTENNPATLTDPSGHCPICVTVAAGAAIGAGFEYGSQVFQNYQSGKSGWDAWTNVRGDRIAMAAVQGAVAGGVGFFAGPLVAGLTKMGPVVSIAAGALEGMASGGLGQLAVNMLWGCDWNAGLAQSMLSGGVAGGLGGALGWAAKQAKAVITRNKATLAAIGDAASATVTRAVSRAFTLSGEVVAFGHGMTKYLSSDGGAKTLTLGQGKYVTLYGEPGDLLTEELGHAIAYAKQTNSPEILAGVFSKTYGPGDQVPNLVLLPPTEPSVRVPNGTLNVEAPTTLRHIISSSEGSFHLHWGACLVCKEIPGEIRGLSWGSISDEIANGFEAWSR